MPDQHCGAGLEGHRAVLEAMTLSDGPPGGPIDYQEASRTLYMAILGYLEASRTLYMAIWRYLEASRTLDTAIWRYLEASRTLGTSRRL